MCLKSLRNSQNVARLAGTAGNPNAQEVWLKTHTLNVMGDYALIVSEAANLSLPITYVIDKGDDEGEYLLRKGLPASLRRKIARAETLAWEIVGELESRPSSGKRLANGTA